MVNVGTGMTSSLTLEQIVAEMRAAQAKRSQSTWASDRAYMVLDALSEAATWAEKLKAERDTAREIQDEILEVLERNGFVHCGNGAAIQAIIDRATKAEAERDAAVAIINEMAPHIQQIKSAARINDEFGRVVVGQTEAAKILAAILARSQESGT